MNPKNWRRDQDERRANVPEETWFGDDSHSEQTLSRSRSKRRGPQASHEQRTAPSIKKAAPTPKVHAYHRVPSRLKGAVRTSSGKSADLDAQDSHGRSAREQDTSSKSDVVSKRQSFNNALRKVHLSPHRRQNDSAQSASTKSRRREGAARSREAASEGEGLSRSGQKLDDTSSIAHDKAMAKMPVKWGSSHETPRRPRSPTHLRMINEGSLNDQGVSAQSGDTTTAPHREMQIEKKQSTIAEDEKEGAEDHINNPLANEGASFATLDASVSSYSRSENISNEDISVSSTSTRDPNSEPNSSNEVGEKLSRQQSGHTQSIMSESRMESKLRAKENQQQGRAGSYLSQVASSEANSLRFIGRTDPAPEVSSTDDSKRGYVQGEVERIEKRTVQAISDEESEKSQLPSSFSVVVTEEASNTIDEDDMRPNTPTLSQMSDDDAGSTLLSFVEYPSPGRLIHSDAAESPYAIVKTDPGSGTVEDMLAHEPPKSSLLPHTSPSKHDLVRREVNRRFVVQMQIQSVQRKGLRKLIELLEMSILDATCVKYCILAIALLCDQDEMTSRLFGNWGGIELVMLALQSVSINEKGASATKTCLDLLQILMREEPHNVTSILQYADAEKFLDIACADHFQSSPEVAVNALKAVLQLHAYHKAARKGDDVLSPLQLGSPSKVAHSMLLHASNTRVQALGIEALKNWLNLSPSPKGPVDELQNVLDACNNGAKMIDNDVDAMENALAVFCAVDVISRGELGIEADPFYKCFQKVLKRAVDRLDIIGAKVNIQLLELAITAAHNAVGRDSAAKINAIEANAVELCLEVLEKFGTRISTLTKTTSFLQDLVEVPEGDSRCTEAAGMIILLQAVSKVCDLPILPSYALKRDEEFLL